MPPSAPPTAVPTAVIVFDRERTIRFDMLTIEAVEAEFDQGFFQVLQGLSDAATQRINWPHLRRFLSACLRGGEPEATPEWVGSHLHLGNIQAVVSTVMTVISSVGGGTEEPAGEGPPSGKPTGSAAEPGSDTTSA